MSSEQSKNSQGELGTDGALGRALERLTAPSDGKGAPKPELWRRALEDERKPRRWMLGGTGPVRLGQPFAVAAGLLLVLGATVLVMMAVTDSLDEAGRRKPDPASAASMMRSIAAAEQLQKELMPPAAPMESLAAFRTAEPRSRELSRAVESPVATDQVTAPDAERFVVRKASIDLAAAEVRGTFAKAGLVLNEALGEYIETSSVNGEGAAATATATLRVTAGRLSEVLNALRQLGKVVAEQTSGQDVTETVVDLDARIRNEQRVERELLAMIDKRPDAPLRDVMAIRAELTTVRSQIESLMGQRQRIGRTVSLATVVVTIRTTDDVKTEPESYLAVRMEQAWTRALRSLVDTAAWIVNVIVGGAVVWLGLGGVAVLGWRIARKAQRQRVGAPPRVE
jgi:hypothetical protein